MRLPTQEQRLAFLRDAANYPDAPMRVEVVETHFAWVFLGPGHVYKLRKPLRHGRMDYRSRAQRLRGCRAEVALGRRLAPGVYEGVVPLTVSSSGRLKLGPGGRVIDHLVKMRRLPAASMLDAVLPLRPLTTSEVTALLDVLGGFFHFARQRPLAAGLYLSRLRREIAGNRRTLMAHVPEYCTHIERVSALQRRCLDGLRAELAARGPLLVDGHGDLRPEHVCIRPPLVIDCIEFDPELRRMDPLEEVAFLAMEIERLGRPAQARALLAGFRGSRRFAGSDALAHFYMSHRAGVRASLSAWHIGDRQYPDPRPWQRRTRSYLRDAERHARDALRRLPADRAQSAGGQRSSSGVNG